MMKRFALEEKGAIGGVEGLIFGVLIFVMGTLLVVNAWNVVDTKLATSIAAREAARAYVESNDEHSASSTATSAATRAMSGYGRRPSHVAFHTEGSGAFGRCRPVRVRVDASVPRIALPLIGGTGGTTVVSSSHTEVVDPYRNGLSGAADCTDD